MAEKRKDGTLKRSIFESLVDKVQHVIDRPPVKNLGGRKKRKKRKVVA
jgi:hypothetical protein